MIQSPWRRKGLDVDAENIFGKRGGREVGQRILFRNVGDFTVPEVGEAG